MTNNNIYFVANWKMFGSVKSVNSLNKVISYSKTKKLKANIIYCPPYTLIKSFEEIVSLFILATLLVLPPLKTLPIPQNTNGIIIIPTSTPASLEFEKPLNLPIIFYSLYLLI